MTDKHCESVNECANGELCAMLKNSAGLTLVGCSHFKPKQPQTNEEWLRSCNTEQLAEWIADKSNEIISWIICEVIENECDVDEDDYWQKKSDVMEWLKEIHHAN